MFGKRFLERKQLVREAEEYLQLEMAKNDPVLASIATFLTLDAYDDGAVVNNLAKVRSRLNVPPSIIQCALEYHYRELRCETPRRFIE